MSSVLMTTQANAEQKIGVVNVQGIFQSVPQAAVIQQTITAEFKDRIEDVNRLEKDIKYYLEKQQRDAATMSATEKDELQKQIIDLRNEYQSKAQPLQQEVQQRQGEERNKILELIKVAIDDIAAKGDYDLVVDGNAVTYLKDESIDLSKAVIDQVSKIK
jgi:outer membrane protein